MANENTRRIQEKIKESLNQKTRLYWETEEPKFNGSVDILGEIEDTFVFIELEMSREDPVANIAKIVRRRFSDEIDRPNIITIQIFSNFYSEIGGYMDRRRRDAVWLGSHCEEKFENFRYHSLSLDITPGRESSNNLPDEWPSQQEQESEVTDIIEKIVGELSGYRPKNGERVSHYSDSSD